MRVVPIAVSLICLAAQAAAGAVVYVDDDQTTQPPDGQSWATAFPSLHDALDAALEEDQIWVAAGTYHPGAAAATFQVPPRVSLYGGFDGVSTDFASRDPVAHQSILDGSATPNPAWHVLTMTNASDPTVLDGFVIRNGRIASITPNRAGGGILLIADESDCAPEISRCWIVGNAANASNGTDGNGGGVALLCLNGGICTPTFTHCVFEDNASIRQGGGVWVGGGSRVVFEDCVFMNNTTGSGSGLSGGAAYVSSNAYADFRRCTFWGNGGGGNGGAIVFDNAAASTVTDSLFYGNYAGPNGNGGGIYATILGTLTVDRTGFVANYGRDGGGVAFDAGTITLRNSIFTGNQATRYGGAIRALTGNTINCTIANNTATSRGGGVWSHGELHNSIVWSNTSTSTTFDNVYTNVVGQKMPAAITYSNIQGGVPAEFGNTSFNLDPEFLDHDGADNFAGSLDDDLRIRGRGVSPCLDAGDNTRIAGASLDFHRRSRLVDDVVAADSGAGPGAIVDIGAVEFPCAGYCEADLNDDGAVDFDDLNVLLLNWGAGSGGCVVGDVDGSGFVNFDDLNRMLLNWGGDCAFPGIGL